jgi:hypothetical protein
MALVAMATNGSNNDHSRMDNSDLEIWRMKIIPRYATKVQTLMLPLM